MMKTLKRCSYLLYYLTALMSMDILQAAFVVTPLIGQPKTFFTKQHANPETIQTTAPMAKFLSSRPSHGTATTTRLAAVANTTPSGIFFSNIVKTLLGSTTVPFIPAFALNAILFTLLSPKLLQMLTLPGFFHSMALGTGLWMTLGWKGWSYCVLYLFLGNLVTKVKFAEKEERGLAEGRGGRRGPENVWYVTCRFFCKSARAMAVEV